MAIVYGIVTGENWNESVVDSMRASRITIDSGQFIGEVFCEDAVVQDFGGAKMFAGGFHIPAGSLVGRGRPGI